MSAIVARLKRRMPTMELWRCFLSELCVGLFGTCGNSEWRKRFIDHYTQAGIPFFNPQVAPGTWKPELAEVEAHHLANDRIILFPVTSETYAEGSLTESGFSIAQAMRFDDRRMFGILIDPNLDPELMKDEERAKASLRSRALARQHLKMQRLEGLYIVDTMDQLFDLSIYLFNAAAWLEPMRQFNPQNRPR